MWQFEARIGGLKIWTKNTAHFSIPAPGLLLGPSSTCRLHLASAASALLRKPLFQARTSAGPGKASAEAMDGAENGAPKPKGSVPEFGGFGENNAGFTGMFEVKKKARREQQDELDFPEPLESSAFDEEEGMKKEKKKKPKSSGANAKGKGGKKKKGKKKKGGGPEQGCCTIL